jgi:hypothetical protein
MPTVQATVRSPLPIMTPARSATRHPMIIRPGGGRARLPLPSLASSRRELQSSALSEFFEPALPSPSEPEAEPAPTALVRAAARDAAWRCCGRGGARAKR